MSDSDDVVLVEHEDVPKLVVGDDVKKNETSTTATTTTAAVETDESTTKPIEVLDDNTPQALNIVSIGTEADAYAFQFHQERLELILSRVPTGAKVAVVSVVGAFRTGKSFLLSWFLRYLHLANKTSSTDDTDTAAWYDTVASLDSQEGFHWRAGTERNTTGMFEGVVDQCRPCGASHHIIFVSKVYGCLVTRT
jgi:hypothetical protein